MPKDDVKINQFKRGNIPDDRIEVAYQLSFHWEQYLGRTGSVS
jgi:hypothetical protein